MAKYFELVHSLLCLNRNVNIVDSGDESSLNSLALASILIWKSADLNCCEIFGLKYFNVWIIFMFKSLYLLITYHY